MSNESTNVWWLGSGDLIPEDYATVTIRSHTVDCPDGTRRWQANGTCPTAKVWVCDLERGGVTVESDFIWPHHPPLDVVIFHLPGEDFKRLLGREKGPLEDILADRGLPTRDNLGILGSRFSG